VGRYDDVIITQTEKFEKSQSEECQLEAKEVVILNHIIPNVRFSNPEIFAELGNLKVAIRVDG